MDEARQKTEKLINRRHVGVTAKRRVQQSQTLNRRFVKRPQGSRTTVAQVNDVMAARTVDVRKNPQKTTKVVAKHAEAASTATTKKSVIVKEAAKVRQVRSGATRATSGSEKRLLKKKGVKLQPSQAFMADYSHNSEKQQRVNDTIKVAQARMQARKAGKQAAQDAKASRKMSRVARVAQATKAQAVRVAQLRGEAAHKDDNATKMAAAKRQLSAQELKDKAIKQALRKMYVKDEESAQFEKMMQPKQSFWKRRGFAVACAVVVVSVLVLGYLVKLNLPDISVRVTAMQTGIEKIYPSYVPANYRLDGMVKEENGRVTMKFKNDIGETFVLKEQKSSWDSTAVLENYVKKEWKDNYTTAKGQGLTIYISESRAAWVNAGVFYEIVDDGKSLSANDLHDIAVSL
ncbi:hypothetical protein IKF15_02555 [Candidatus Saccharibacteria bacterium]|nr:hypothetical protein [Candidatus Saccharibacteria bacterium]